MTLSTRNTLQLLGTGLFFLVMISGIAFRFGQR